MKNLYLIGGPMGVGKTTVGQFMKEKLNNSVYLDGDWCWDMAPFRVCEKSKNMVIDNITHLLNNFIHNDMFENIIFCWVMDKQEIIDSVVDKLDRDELNIVKVSLICDSFTLTKRIMNGVKNGTRSLDLIERACEYIAHYKDLDTVKIDVSDIGIKTTAETVIALSNKLSKGQE